jgi:hypothetical protein
MQSATRIALLFLMAAALMLPACVYQTGVDPCAPGVAQDGSSWEGPDIAAMNTRMELIGDASVTGNVLWLRSCLVGQQNCATDEMTVKWDSYKVNWVFDRDATCDFSSLAVNQMVGDCARCDYCVGQPSCPSGILEDPIQGQFGPTVVRFEGFVTDAGGPAELDNFHYGSGCPNPQVAQNHFKPTGKATYQVLAAKFSSYNSGCDVRQILTEKKIVVVSDMATASLHPLTAHADPNSPLVFFKGSIGSNSDWNAGFSSQLRVTKIRIRQGSTFHDPKTGLFGLDELTATPVRPSRIVIFPAFHDGDSVFDLDTTRCYSDASEYGDIDLRRCRNSSPFTGTDPCTVVPRSPTACVDLRANPTHLSSAPNDILTWFVEFNPAEGGVVPDPTKGDIVIEFTIEGV